VRRGRILGARELVLNVPGAGGRPSARSVRRLLLAYGLKGAAGPRLHRAVRRLRGGRRYAPPWLRPDAAHAFAASDDQAAWKELDGPRWWAHLVGAVLHGGGPRLAYDHIRRRAAAAGLEPRHPLVDVDAIELVLSLPPELAYDPARSRPLLREALTGLLPDRVRLRPGKSTFDALFHAALAGHDLPVVRELLGAPDARVAVAVDLELMRAVLLDPGPPGQPYARMRWAIHVWRLVTAECWLRQLEDPAATAGLRADPRLRAAAVTLARRAPRPPAVRA
jgi:hypothetical protein